MLPNAQSKRDLIVTTLADLLSFSESVSKCSVANQPDQVINLGYNR